MNTNTHDIDIELPHEFRKGNDILFTQATIKRERMEEILREAIEADRKRRKPTAAEISDVIREITGCPDIKNGEDSLVVALEMLFHRGATPQPAEPESCFCDRMYPDSNPDASCGDCPIRDYGEKAAEPVSQHPDDAAVDAFAAVMKAKLAKKRSEGRDGWQECSAEYLSDLLRSHVEKGDPVDVANLAMMLHQNGQWIEPAEVDAKASVPSDDVLADALTNLEHDNYEQSYSGYKNRQADVELIRAALAARGSNET